MSDLQSFLAAIEAKREAGGKLAEAATPGPWSRAMYSGVVDLLHPSGTLGALPIPFPDERHPHCALHDAAFIVASRTLVPELLSDLDTARRLIARLVEQRDDHARGSRDNMGDTYTDEEVAEWRSADNAALDAIVRGES